MKSPLAANFKTNAEQKFWKRNDSKNLKILYALLEGKTPEEVTVDMKLYPSTIPMLLQNQTFNAALQETLNSRYFSFQLKKVQDYLLIYDTMFKEFKKRISRASDDTVVKEFLKLAFQKVEKTEIRAQFVKILNQTIKSGGVGAENAEEIMNYFDYEEPSRRLQEAGDTDTTEDESEGPEHSEVGIRKATKDEQGIEDRVQRSQVSMGLSGGSQPEDSSA